jgi:ribosomal protein S18 acetylase RimI-like enzyme
MQGLIVRTGVDADIEAAVAVYRAANDARRGSPTPEPHVERVRPNMRRPDALLVVAELEGRCVGVGLGMQSREDQGLGEPIPTVCYLSMIFVHPDWWGIGIGGRLTDAVIEQAAAAGYQRIHLWTHANNTRAQQLYERLAFRRTGKEQTNDLGEPIVEYERERLQEPGSSLP